MKVSVLLLGLLVGSLTIFYPSNAEEICPSGTVGLCDPGVTEVIESTTETESSTNSSGTTTIDTTTTTTTTTTVTNEDTGDLLTDEKVSEMGRNQRYGGDMTTDWGGQGPASMGCTGSKGANLGTDKCAQITGSGNNTSTMGVPGMGTTFIQTITVSNLGIGSKGGRTNYTIKVDKQDASDRIYMHITGKDGSTVSFAGTDILSEAGVASGYQAYSGGFDFGGTLTTLIVEVGGRDINLSIGPLFDDVTVNVLWNVINTIVTEQITTIETFVALGVFDQETIEVATTVFENNNISIGPAGETNIQPNIDENMEDMPTYETVSMEMNMEMPDIDMSGMGSTTDMDMPTIDMPVPEVEIEMNVSIEMEMPNVEPTMDAGPSGDTTNTEVSESPPETQAPEPVEVTPEPTEPEPVEVEVKPEPTEPEPETTSDTQTAEAKPEPTETSDSNEQEEDVVEAKPEPKKEVKAEPKKVEPKKAEPKKVVVKKASPKKVVKAKAKPKTKQEKKQEAKQKAAKKIMKKMGDRGKYDSINQLKTLVVMQVLGNTREFFSAQKLIPQPEGFFTDTRIPDATISDNNYNQYFMFGGSDAAHDALVNTQYRR